MRTKAVYEAAHDMHLLHCWYRGELLFHERRRRKLGPFQGLCAHCDGHIHNYLSKRHMRRTKVSPVLCGLHPRIHHVEPWFSRLPRHEVHKTSRLEMLPPIIEVLDSDGGDIDKCCNKFSMRTARSTSRWSRPWYRSKWSIKEESIDFLHPTRLAPRGREGYRCLPKHGDLETYSEYYKTNRGFWTAENVEQRFERIVEEIEGLSLSKSL